MSEDLSGAEPEGTKRSRPERRHKRGPISYDIDVHPVDQSKVAIGPDAVGVSGPHAAIAAAGEPEVWCRHNRIDLALHHLQVAQTGATSCALLILHGLGECIPAETPIGLRAWNGDVWGLDFTGHGHSSIPRGGGYTAELLMGDVDAALAHLGTATVVGRGLGAYVALLIAGARPKLVNGAILCDGPGIVGGGIGPGSPRITLAPPSHGSPDFYALAELSVDVRPPDYALTYLHQAVQFSELTSPVTIVGSVRPPWLAAIEHEPGVRLADLAEALDRYA